jgi:DUF4097 and DUF4098 domain-containing protein YvlB
MNSRTLRLAVVAAAFALVPWQPARAQDMPSSSRNCSTNHYGNGLEPYSETRDQKLPASATNRVNPGQNGSVMIHGWNQADVLVRACIQVGAPSEAEARSLISAVKIARGPGDIEPDGPVQDEQHRWDVSYEVWMPIQSSVEAAAHNGSIAIESIHGQIRFDTVNGSVHLNKVAGDVDGSTTNGSVNVTLDGSGWQGHGLRAETTNGSVRLSLPDNYSAKVEASTVNGRVHVDFPITVSGEIGKTVSFQLGSGGSTIELRTTNGSVSIGRT